jgi:hypothetical protein
VVGDKQDEDDSGPTGVPATLPPELRRNLKPGTAMADSAKGLTIEQIVLSLRVDCAVFGDHQHRSHR